MSRRSRLARTAKRTVLPPRQQLRAEAEIIRENSNPKAVAVANAYLALDAEMLTAGYVLREGGGEATKPLPLPKELQPYERQWRKPPPEYGETS
jgi:hypothetical protein